MIPITVITGFLGSGKTTLILNLIPQLPKEYKLALLKNEFGDLAIDSQLASSAAISGVQELLNGCICCNLVGQLGDALDSLRCDVRPDRIIIETSGSAFPATLAMEVNRLGRETGHYVLDGVVSVIDVENWKGYDDTSYTAKMQAKYTDVVILNKWELVDERRYEDCLDRIGDLEVQVATVKSDRGFVPQGLLLGLDNALSRAMDVSGGLHSENGQGKEHDHASDHQSEVEVLSVTMELSQDQGVEQRSLVSLLTTAPKDEVYRIKGVLPFTSAPLNSEGLDSARDHEVVDRRLYILNWAFGRWTFTLIKVPEDSIAPFEAGRDQGNPGPELRLTIITARGESEKWKKKLLTNEYIKPEGSENVRNLKVTRIS